MHRYRWWIAGGAFVFVAALVAIFALSGTGPTPPARRIGPPGTGPLTIVTLGDSTLSGEGAGDYTPSTDGQNGDWCHRSPNAEVYETHVPDITAKINFACSGAPSAQVALGDAKQWTELSQSQQLSNLTHDHRVAAVVVAVGANDEPQFAKMISDCVGAWFNPGAQPCSNQIRQGWRARIDAMVPKVVNALGDVKKALTARGYLPEDYQLVLQSYAAPVGPGIPENLRNLNGCPFRTEDLRWISSEGVQVLTNGLRTAAGEAGARFLDLSRAGDGHEACSGGANPSTEWFSRLSLQLDDLAKLDRATHALQESFHPNKNGHEQIGRCLTEFLGTADLAAACRSGADGNLHAATSNAQVR